MLCLLFLLQQHGASPLQHSCRLAVWQTVCTCCAVYMPAALLWGNVLPDSDEYRLIICAEMCPSYIGITYSFAMTARIGKSTAGKRFVMPCGKCVAQTSSEAGYGTSMSLSLEPCWAWPSSSPRAAASLFCRSALCIQAHTTCPRLSLSNST